MPEIPFSKDKNKSRKYKKLPKALKEKIKSQEEQPTLHNELPQYDSLKANGVPYESSDRTTRHPRILAQKLKAISGYPDDFMSGFPIKELEKYDNKEITYIVECSLRIIRVLRLWIDEKMSYEMFCYYCYFENPCQQKLLIAVQNIDQLITKLHYHKPQLGDKVKTLYDALKGKVVETDNYYKSLSELRYWNEKNYNLDEVKKYAEALRKTLLHIQSMFYTELGNGGEVTTIKIIKKEANVRARQLLKETPTWDWTCRKLAEQIPCSLGWIPYLPAWRAYHEKRQELKRNKTIKTVSISEELNAVLGSGDKDEVLKQLIAEQEGDQREDARQAKLYLSHQKKQKRSK
ncbi:hypothetical protein ACFLZ8_02505 [Planctomycetota bacterium]